MLIGLKLDTLMLIGLAAWCVCSSPSGAKLQSNLNADLPLCVIYAVMTCTFVEKKFFLIFYIIAFWFKLVQ